MSKIFAIALIGFGIAIGVTFGDEIKAIINGEPYESAKETVEDMTGTLGDSSSDLMDKVKKALD